MALMDWSWLDHTISVGELLLWLGLLAGGYYLAVMWFTNFGRK